MNYVGIDPSFRKSGFAVCVIDETGEVGFKVFYRFLEFIKWATTEGELPQPAYITIENSNLQNITFNMRGSRNVVAKTSRDVGKNMAASQYTVDFCEWLVGSGNVLGISPRQKGAKWNDATFRAVLRQNRHTVHDYKGNKNEQDKRDAYQLALHGMKHASTRKMLARARK